MTIAGAVARLREWAFCSTALRRARAQIPDWTGARGRAARQAKLLVEVARGVAEPVEVLPPGSRPAVMLPLYREAVTWALFALGPESESPPDLATLWEARRPETLLPGVEPEAVEVVRRSLAAARPGALDGTEEDARRVRAFAEALVAALYAPRRRARRLLLRRWSAIGVLGAALVAAGFGVSALARGPNLVAGRAFRTSSTWAGCPNDPNCVGLLFCTDSDANPWIEFDLEKPRKLHRIDVTNRVDCCAERAVPLLVEASDDRSSWTEIGRRDTDFKQWTAELKPTRARYVRLRVPRTTVFHLQELEIH